MLQSLAIQRGSHGQHTMPATPERSLHVLLSDFDPSLAAFLEVPGPFSNRSRMARLSEELEACGLIGWFWLHNVESAATIAPKFVWSGCFGLSREPLGRVRDYFGTEISWDLLYMNFMARWMVVPAMGSAAYSYVTALAFLSTGSVDNPFLPLFSVGLIVWGMIMLFFWGRLERRYQEKWREDVNISGRDDINTDAVLETKIDDETGEVKLVYPEWKHKAKKFAASALMAPCLALVLGAGLLALDFRARIINLDPKLIDGISVGGMLGGVATAAIIFIATRLVCYHWCAVLTNWENYTKRSGYIYSLGVKCFLIDLVAHAFPLIYLALLDFPILSRFAPASKASIMDSLTVQAVTVFTAWWLCTATFSYFEAYLLQRRADAEVDRVGSKPDLSHEEQHLRPNFPGYLTTNAWMSVQLIYSFVFAAVCPVAPLLMYIWVLHRLNWDRSALLYVYKRPHPHPSPGGNFWMRSIFFVMLLALAVQIPIILFCSKALTFWLPSITLEDRWGIFILLEILVLVLSSYVLSKEFRGEDAEGSERV
uniref:Anoctamin transmembrane domain-containing protein n=1 Tax=Hanusia phi TaxID=3032 RepID=A0A7S0HMC5_9CRYP